MPNFVDTVDWLDDEALLSYESLVVICGLWLAEEPEKTGMLLQERSNSGRSTLIVPRYRGGDLASIIGAPTAVEIKPGDADEVEWEEDRGYAVSSVSYLQTSLHTGRCGKSKQGLVILCFRPSTAGGIVVVCTAALFSRSIGVSKAEQAALFGRIRAKLDSLEVVRPKASQETGYEAKAENLDAFLDEEGAEGAALLLAMVADEQGTGSLGVNVQNLLGLELPARRLDHLQNRMPQAAPEEISAVLRRRGWAAYVRRISQLASGAQL
ncbi:MAG: hypothetical protein KME65_13410 [Candidatus Thiodiazotropha sp. (ex Ctena orbiculata)]|uniref:Uncharacterized protein n=1 Tax=Candidatus Thiodiazotropha taylori TaxID=2792791 RepID=A0A944M9R9_9GAMM|nr:hypothetical protein [Candidatus Thiodiazotropha taylori]